MDRSEILNGSEIANTLDQRIELQEKTFDRLSEWIRGVDAKVPIVLALDTAILGTIVAFAPLPADFAPTDLAWISFGCLAPALSLLFILLGTFPQTRGPEGSLIFFGGIATRTFADYSRAVANQSRNQYFSDLLSQTYRNAQIATAKYGHIRRSLMLLVVGVPPWLLSLYILVRG